MIKPLINLQDLRRRLYDKAKAEKSWRFWGLYTHVCKEETLKAAYQLAKRNNGAPGIDGVTFEGIEAAGVNKFLSKLRKELVDREYRPLGVRKVEIPKESGTRSLSIPTIRDRVVQGALKLILEPIFEADFQPGSFGYRPQRSAHQAVERVTEAILTGKTIVIDLDLRSYFDSVRHHILLDKVAQRINDDAVMGLLKLMLKASGKRGVPQGGVISPLLSNLYLNEVDKMLEQAILVTPCQQLTEISYTRFADDLVVMVRPHSKNRGLYRALLKRLQEEFAKLQVAINEDKSRIVDLRQRESFGFLGFEFRRIRSRRERWRPLVLPQPKKRMALLRKLKLIFRGFRSQPVEWLIEVINPVLRGWVNYFAIGSSSRCFSFIRNHVEKKIRRHLAKARLRQGFGWKRWSKRWLYEELGLFCAYRVSWMKPCPKLFQRDKSHKPCDEVCRNA